MFGTSDTAGGGLDSFMDWNTLLNTTVSGLVGAIAAILVARLSKSKAQRDVEVAKEYLSLAGITADELEKRINLVSKLDDDNRKLQNDIFILKQKQNDAETKRLERDEQLEVMSAQIAALQAQIDKDARERHDLEKKLAEFEIKNRVLWKYLIALLEQFRYHKIKPVEPPNELTDPEILKLVKEIKESK